MKREDVLQTGQNLSNLLIQRGEHACGSVAEMAVTGGAVVVGAYGYLGLIDDAERRVYSFGTGSALCRQAFDSTYASLVRVEGYERVDLPNTRFLGAGEDSAVINFLTRREIPLQVQSALAGDIQPVAGLVTHGRDSERSYVWGQIIDNAAFAGGDLGRALALSAAAQNGEPKRAGGIGLSPGERVVKPINWPTALREFYNRGGTFPKVTF